MGIGDAYLGLVDLLSNNGQLSTANNNTIMRLTNCAESCTDDGTTVECLIGFVADTSVQAIKRATDDTIQHWYHAVSL